MLTIRPQHARIACLAIGLLSLDVQPALAGTTEGVVAFKADDYESAVAGLDPAVGNGHAEVRKSKSQNGERPDSEKENRKLALAVELFKSGKFVEVLELVRPLAESGNPSAEMLLAGMYMLGLGVDKDIDKAEDLYLRVERHGSPKAAIALSTIYVRQHRINKAKGILVKYAERGHAGVALILASYYASGQVFIRDMARAKHWYRISAQNGSLEAKRILKSLDSNNEFD